MSDLILGIETSCDETAAAVVVDGRQILSNVVATQVEMHARYGGVFPEVASREHVLKIVPVLRAALETANVTWSDLAAVAVTYGPGLAGSLLVGVNAAKGLALGNHLPLLGVNHLEGHIYANWLEAAVSELPPAGRVFPLVALIVSGGHSEIVLMRGHGAYEMLGRTMDDAAGEAFDKVARLLGLGYPGGPAIQKAAEQGDPNVFKLPRAWLGESYDFSFSGLKTAALHLVRKFDGQTLPVADIAASFQEAIVEVMVTKTLNAARSFGASQILLAGGVAANKRLREQMQARADMPVLIPPPKLCVDNGAMIAAAAWWHYRAGNRSDLSLDVIPNLRLADKPEE
ncbi:MAG: tRNA (adenosine(37)-N6)-threonylcarbamoyltransferase complex transferase subunit TsaD [Anaerolineae bacterium]